MSEQIVSRKLEWSKWELIGTEVRKTTAILDKNHLPILAQTKNGLSARAAIGANQPTYPVAPTLRSDDDLGRNESTRKGLSPSHKNSTIAGKIQEGLNSERSVLEWWKPAAIKHCSGWPWSVGDFCQINLLSEELQINQVEIRVLKRLMYRSK